MLRSVFGKWLRDNRRSLLGWTIAVAAVGVMYAAFWPSIRNPEMQKAMASYPKGILEAFNYNDMASAAGYLAGSVFGVLVPLLVLVFMIAAGTRAVAGDEEAGTLDLLLAHPVSRTRLAAQRLAAVGVELVVVVAALWLMLAALTGPAELDGVTLANLAAVCLQLVLFGALFGALAYAIGAATGRKGLAIGLSAAIAVLAWLANGIIPQVEGMEWARDLSPFHWYLGGEPLTNGLQIGGSLLLLGFAAALATVGTLAFTRRDIAV